MQRAVLLLPTSERWGNRLPEGRCAEVGAGSLTLQTPNNNKEKKIKAFISVQLTRVAESARAAGD